MERTPSIAARAGRHRFHSSRGQIMMMMMLLVVMMVLLLMMMVC